MMKNIRIIAFALFYFYGIGYTAGMNASAVSDSQSSFLVIGVSRLEKNNPLMKALEDGTLPPNTYFLDKDNTPGIDGPFIGADFNNIDSLHQLAEKFPNKFDNIYFDWSVDKFIINGPLLFLTLSEMLKPGGYIYIPDPLSTPGSFPPLFFDKEKLMDPLLGPRYKTELYQKSIQRKVANLKEYYEPRLREYGLSVQIEDNKDRSTKDVILKKIRLNLLFKEAKNSHDHFGNLHHNFPLMVITKLEPRDS